jgi:hypothetical protein
MEHITPVNLRITGIILVLIVASLVVISIPLTSSVQYSTRIMPSRSTGMADAARRRQEDNAMAIATLQKEMDGAKKDGSKSSNEGSRGEAVNTNPRPSVVSPPAAPNLTSLLAGQIGQEAEQQAARNGIALDGGQVDENMRSPIKKKSKKAKSTKEDKSTKCDRSGSSLKKSSSMTTLAPTFTTTVKDYKFERVFYEAGLELKGEDKYSAYVKHIGSLFENIQLVDPLAIMHAVDENRGDKPLGSKSEMSTNMTVFLAYAPVGRNARPFQPKRNNDKKKSCRGKD